LELAEGVAPFSPIDSGDLTNDFETGREPEPSAGIFVNLDDDPELEIIEYGVSCDTVARALDVDHSTGLMTPIEDFPLPKKGTVMAAADLNRDGHLDFIKGQLPLEMVFGGEIGKRRYWEGDTEHLGCGIANAVGLEDMDKDGWLDVLIFLQNCDEVFQAGPGVAVFINLGNANFQNQTDAMLDGTAETASYAGYLTKLGDSEEVLVTAPVSCGGTQAHCIFRQDGHTDSGYPIYTEYFPTTGVPGFRAAEVEHDQDKPLSYFALMGMATADVNKNGSYEMAIATNPRFLLFGIEDLQYTDYSLELSMFSIPTLEGNHEQFGWGVAWLDLNWDGYPEFLTANGPDYVPFEPGHPDNMGPQQLAARWNAGNFAFGDVTESLGFGLAGEFRGLTIGDMDLDGDPDILLGVTGLPLRVYRNDLTAGEGLSLRLTGTTSNQFARGAEVFLLNEAGLATHRFQVSNQATPNAVSEHLVFLPSTSEGFVERIRIIWPTGIEQVIPKLATKQQHQIIEPESIIITPKSRRLTGHGEDSFRVEIVPRALDGSIADSEEAVELSFAYGTATVEKEDIPGKHRFKISQNGDLDSAVIVVKIGTKTLTVRPRIFFQP